MAFKAERLLVVGLGLIGGSFARAAKDLVSVQQVVGFDLNQEECDLALALNVVDSIATDLESAVKESDLILLAVPVKAIEKVMQQIAPWLKPEVILTDVGSTKLNILEAAKGIWPEGLPAGFIPGHPIAGAEKSGVSASQADLFNHKKVILTPPEVASADATLALARIWQAIGAEVVQMEPKRHDQVLAATSHLPHLLAFSLADTLAAEAESTDIFRYAAGGFRDFTRIAASDPTMWHDVCFANREQLLEQIDRFMVGVEDLRAAVDQGDSQSLLGIFTRAKASREHFSLVLERAGYAELRGDAIDTLVTSPTAKLSGELRVPGDRSISQRAIMLAAIAEGVSEIDGLIESEDTLATIQIFRDMGVVIEGPHQGRVRVFGVGLKGLQTPSAPLYFGSSMTSLRMLLGLLSAQDFDVTLTGSEQLSKLSLQEIIDPLTQMGASIESGSGSLPITIKGGQAFKSITYAPSHASAQIKGALLLAAISSGVELEVYEPNTTRDHTERLLDAFGVKLVREGRRLFIESGVSLKACSVQVPADLSFAFAFAVGALLQKESSLAIENVSANPTRLHSLRLLERMGAQIALNNSRHAGGEPVADLLVKASSLSGIECLSSELASVGDDLPLLLLAMASAQSDSIILGIDRIPERQKTLFKTTVDELIKAGADIAMSQTDVTISPVSHWRPCELEAAEHPALALALLMLSLRFDQSIRINGCRAISTAFPELIDQARRVGIKLIEE